MSRNVVIELKANWNGPLSTTIPIEQLSKMRRWVFGGGILLIALGVWLFLKNSISGILEIMVGIILLSIGIFVETIKNKPSFRGTSIDFPSDYLNQVFKKCEDFLKENRYYYEKTEENYKILKGKGFELQPSRVRLIIFNVKAPISGHVARLGIRNIDKQNLQQAIELQIKLDNYFIKNSLIGKNPANIRTRYEWDGAKYIPMQ